MLRIHKINSYYGIIKALWDVSLTVEEGEIVAVLGANGAGKSTLVKSIVGLVRPVSGMIKFAGRRIDGRDPHRIRELGIAYGPEGGGLFRDMSVGENLEMGAYHREAWERRKASLRRIYRLFPTLEERKHQLTRTLSGGERQMVMIGRALMALPTFCVFDEPSVGLSPLLVRESFDVIGQLRDEGITVLLIEQNVNSSLKVADRAYVLESGRIVSEGRARDLLETDLIRRAYLGL